MEQQTTERHTQSNLNHEEDDMRYIYRLFALVGGILLFLTGVNVFAQQTVSSVRDSQYEWQCEREDGTVISGHTRQDKAFQSCYNAALADTANRYIVRGGTYRVTATGTGSSPTDPTPTPPPTDPGPDPSPEPEPDPGPEPPDPDPTPEPEPTPSEEPLVTFGFPNPITQPVRFPNTISALRQDVATWRVTFTLNSLQDRQGLFSLDETGQDELGHLSVYVWPDGGLQVRHQDLGSGQVGTRTAAGTIAAGQEYVVDVSIDTANGLGIFIDGQLVFTDPVAYGTLGNNNELVVGGLCVTCEDPDRVITFPIDGQVQLEIYDDARELPQANGSLELSWVNPTARMDETPLDITELRAARIYETKPSNFLTAEVLDVDAAYHEVTGLWPGVEYCFEATVVDTDGLESPRSEPACKVVN